MSYDPVRDTIPNDDKRHEHIAERVASLLFDPSATLLGLEVA